MDAFKACLNETPHQCLDFAYEVLPYARGDPRHTFLAFANVATYNLDMLKYIFVASQFLTLIFVIPFWGLVFWLGRFLARGVRAYPIAVTVMLFSFVVGLAQG